MKTQVFIPTYNSASSLGFAINSVLRQSLPVESVTVVDDQSSDNTEALVRTFANVHYARNAANLGPCANWSRCVDLATGDYVALLHADDVLLPDWHAKCSAALQTVPNPLDYCVFVGGAEFEESGRVVGVHTFADKTRRCEPGELLRVVWRHCFYGLKASANVLYSRRVLLDMGGFPAADYPAMADVPLHLRMMTRVPFLYVPDPLVMMRVGTATSISNARKAELAIGAFRALNENVEALTKSLNEDVVRVRAEYAFAYWVAWLLRKWRKSSSGLPSAVVAEARAAIRDAGCVGLVRNVLREGPEFLYRQRQLIRHRSSLRSQLTLLGI